MLVKYMNMLHYYCDITSPRIAVPKLGQAYPISTRRCYQGVRDVLAENKDLLCIPCLRRAPPQAHISRSATRELSSFWVCRRSFTTIPPFPLSRSANIWRLAASARLTRDRLRETAGGGLEYNLSSRRLQFTLHCFRRYTECMRSLHAFSYPRQRYFGYTRVAAVHCDGSESIC